MSTKSTILLTNDDEHWYNDSSEPLSSSKEVITLEFSKKNIRIDFDDDEKISISIINPDSELYKALSEISKHFIWS